MAAKSERLLNLTIALLSTKRPLTKDEIRRTVAGYEEQSPTAFERMFERDKDELRAMGVPVETFSLDAYFDDEVGYRIPPETATLPPVEFTADEAAVLGVAARAWRESSMASATASALGKLRGAGIEPDTTRLAGLDPVVTAREPSFGAVAEAVRVRTRIRFGYRDQTRTLEPWALTSSKGRWYVLGRDVDRDAPRMFRLSRMTTVPTTASRAGAYAIPDDVDVRALSRALEPPESTRTALVAVRAGRAAPLRRRGTAAEAPADVTVPDGFDVLSLGYSSDGFLVGELAGYGADVVVYAPDSVRAGLIEHLRGVLATHGSRP